MCGAVWRVSLLLWTGLVLGFYGPFATAAGVSDNTLPGLPPPEDVHVVSVSEHSVTVQWKQPKTSANSAAGKPLAYVIVYSPVGTHGQEEKEVVLAPTLTSTSLKDLEPDLQYSVVVSAIYMGYARAPAPKLIVSVQRNWIGSERTHQGHGNGLNEAVRDDVYPEKEPECNCSAAGMVACMRTARTFRCSCFPGYEGQWCQLCSKDFFRAGKECLPCPCSNLTSTGVCIHDSKTSMTWCESCLPGHRGPECRSCSAGYHWKEDRCQPVNCLSFSLCAEEKDAPGCADCVFLEESVPANAQKSNAERGLSDGTVPLVAVIVTLAIIVLVAASATCYRYWSRQQMRGPRRPFWSIELHEEKLNLDVDCQYHQLDASRAAAAADPKVEHEVANVSKNVSTTRAGTVNV